MEFTSENILDEINFELRDKNEKQYEVVFDVFKYDLNDIVDTINTRLTTDFSPYVDLNYARFYSENIQLQGARFVFTIGFIISLPSNTPDRTLAFNEMKIEYRRMYDNLILNKVELCENIKDTYRTSHDICIKNKSERSMAIKNIHSKYSYANASYFVDHLVRKYIIDHLTKKENQ